MADDAPAPAAAAASEVAALDEVSAYMWWLYGWREGGGYKWLYGDNRRGEGGGGVIGGSGGGGGKYGRGREVGRVVEGGGRAWLV